MIGWMWTLVGEWGEVFEVIRTPVGSLVVLDGGLLCSAVLAAALFYRDAGALI